MCLALPRGANTGSLAFTCKQCEFALPGKHMHSGFCSEGVHELWFLSLVVHILYGPFLLERIALVLIPREQMLCGSSPLGSTYSAFLSPWEYMLCGSALPDSYRTQWQLLVKKQAELDFFGPKRRYCLKTRPNCADFVPITSLESERVPI